MRRGASQPADFTATSLSATSITAVVIAVAANADASFTPPPPVPPAERRRLVCAAAASAASGAQPPPPPTPFHTSDTLPSFHAAAAITPDHSLVHTLSTCIRPYSDYSIDYSTTRQLDYSTTRLLGDTRLFDYSTTRLLDYSTTRLLDYLTTRLLAERGGRFSSRALDVHVFSSFFAFKKVLIFFVYR